MSTLDDIAQERQRISDRLSRLDAERANLAEQLTELEAAERVIARFSAPRPGRPRRDSSLAAAEEPARRRRGRPRRSDRAAPASSNAPALGDATLRAVEALGDDISAEEVRDYLAREFGMQVRPNHLGMALQRHRRAGRLQLHGSKWSMAQPNAA